VVSPVGLIHSLYTSNEVIAQSAFLALANKVGFYEKFTVLHGAPYLE